MPEQETEQEPAAPSEPEPLRDDPEQVPKPSRARKKAKKMPEYQKPEPAAKYEPPTDTKENDVEINMIDL